MRAIGYFSEFPLPDGQTGRRTTLSQQNDDFLAYCDQHGYEPAAAFLDPTPDPALADSGAWPSPGLHQLLEYLRRPEKGFLTVVVASFNHLGPSAVEAARSYFLISARGAQLASIAEGALDEAQILRLWADQKKGNGVGDRVRDAMRRRAVKGQVLGRPPYGYRVGPDRRLELVQDEAALVRYIFRLHVDEDLGIRRIAKRLNEEGYRTRRDGNWSMVTIRDLLRNRVYVGTYSRFGVKVPGNHTAIIDSSDFQRVQDRMDQRRKPAAAPQPSRFLLSGLVYCDDSASRMIGVTRRQQWTRRDGEVASNTYRYYQSEARTNQSVGDYHTRRADELEAEVLRHLTGESPGAVRPAVLHAGNADAVAAGMAVSESRVRSRMRALDRRLSGNLNAAVGGNHAPERLRTSGQEIAAEYLQAEEELDLLNRRAAAQASDSERRRHQERQLLRVRNDWDGLSFEERQALVRDLVEKVIIEGKTVQTVLHA